MLDQAWQAEFIMTMDFIKGYYQVPVRGVDQDKTAFTHSPFVKYRFTRMPFVLKFAQTTFHTSWMESWTGCRSTPRPIQKKL